MASILILEDDYELAAEWRSALRAHGHEVDISYTSSEAIALADGVAYDIFIVDLIISPEDVPIKDSGRNFLIHLNEKAAGRRAPPTVIGVSGFRPGNSSDIARSVFYTYRVRDVLMKPFAAADLVGQVDKLLAAGGD